MSEPIDDLVDNAQGESADVHAASNKKATRGGVVLLAVSILGRFLSFAKGIIIARFFLPEHLGTFTVGMLVLGLFLAVSEAGVRQYVIAADDEERALGGAFRFLLLSVAVAFPIMLVAGPVLEHVLDEPGLRVVLWILSTGALTLPLTLASSTFDRDYSFGKAKIPDFADLIIGTVASVVLLYFLEPEHALSVGYIIGVYARAILVWVLAPRRPKFAMGKGELKNVMRFGIPLSLSAISGYIADGADDYYVRQFAGREELGFYTFAFWLPATLLAFVAITNRVMLPWLRERKGDQKEIAKAFAESNHFIAIIAAPLGFGLAISAPEILSMLYGDKWLPALPLVQLFAVSFVMRSTTGYNWGVLALLRGETSYIGFVSLLTMFFALIVGLPLIYYYGAMGGAYYNIVQLGLMTPLVRFPMIRRACGDLSYLRKVWRPLVFSLIGALAYAGARYLGVMVLNEASFLFGLGFVSFVLVYVALSFWFDPSARQLISRVQGMVRKRSGG